MSRIRVGAVSYLNTKPLVDYLPDLAPDIDLVFDVPRNLARSLASRSLDIALIPSIEYFRAQGRYSLLAGTAIASFGPVLSVKVVSQVPFGAIETLAVDDGSRTSIALADILLDRLFGVNPATVAFPLGMDVADADADAVLVIGDRAMRVRDGAFPYTLDLGYEWSRWTGLPFVFAAWAVRDGVTVSPDLEQQFLLARDRGRQAIRQIAAREAERLGLDPLQCEYYLEYSIRHDLGPLERAGLARFYELAVERGLAPSGVDCVFHNRVASFQSC